MRTLTRIFTRTLLATIRQTVDDGIYYAPTDANFRSL
jgi:hypothetical protein